MKIHRGEKNHKCTICGTRYVTSGELKSHTRHIHSSNKPFTCTFENCFRGFVTKSSLKTHLHAHTGKLFLCIVCGKALCTAASLSEHKRIHDGMKSKQCSLCKCAFGNANSLKKHMRQIHSNQLSFECEMCSDKFAAISSLSAHIKMKHQEKSFQCSICNKRFALELRLKRHMNLHHNDNMAMTKQLDAIPFSGQIVENIEINHSGSISTDITVIYPEESITQTFSEI